MRVWLIELRKAAGYTQTDVASVVGISQPTYCNIENAERRPSPETAQKIASLLGFSWTRFYTDEAHGSEDPEPD